VLDLIERKGVEKDQTRDRGPSEFDSVTPPSLPKFQPARIVHDHLHGLHDVECIDVKIVPTE
jgi:hypothetical protein